MSSVFEEAAIRAIKDLADYNFQKIAWFATGGPVVSSLTEDICVLYDDTGLGDALDAGESVFGAEADQSLRELLTLAQSVPKRRPPEEVIDDPQMQKVRDKAAATLKLVQQAYAAKQPS